MRTSRRANISWSTLVKAAVCIGVGAIISTAQSTSSGVHPRSAPSDYSAVQRTGTGTYAASLLSPNQVKDLFAVDISKTYMVFEVACYPTSTGMATIHPDDFLIKTGKNSEFVHPADAVTVASVIQRKNAPPPPSNKDSEIYTSANIGYESGTDPYTGRRVHSVYTGAGVGVGPAQPGDPYPMPRAGGTSRDRAILESQLADKALPEGSFSKPVAGFVYFPAKEIRKKANGRYDLEYLSDSSGKVQLQVSAKSR